MGCSCTARAEGHEATWASAGQGCSLHGLGPGLLCRGAGVQARWQWPGLAAAWLVATACCTCTHHGSQPPSGGVLTAAGSAAARTLSSRSAGGPSAACWVPSEACGAGSCICGGGPLPLVQTCARKPQVGPGWVCSTLLTSPPCAWWLLYHVMLLLYCCQPGWGTCS